MEYEVESSESLSVAVIQAVSSVEQRPMTSLPPLHDIIDPDGLDALFTHKNAEKTGQDSLISFSFSNSQVTIVDGESITVQPHLDYLTAV